jgi:hypothetical protein
MAGRVVSKSRRSIYSSLVALLVVALSTGAIVANAQNNQMIPWSDAWVNRQFDWIIYINLDRIDRFLKYPGSIAPGLTRVLLDYRLCPRPRNKDLNMDRQKYQDIWYQNGAAVGLRRYKDLIDIPYQEQGCLYIPPDALVATSMKPLTNAIARIILELYWKKEIVTSICVPKDSFNDFASALGQLNFFRLDVAVPGGPGQNMSIHVITQPAGFERYFYYDDTGRRGPVMQGDNNNN